MPDNGDNALDSRYGCHRWRGGAHADCDRVAGVHRAHGLAGPTRRYLLIVGLLAGTASLPMLATIGTGSATTGGTGTGGAAPFIEPPSDAPSIVVPLSPTVLVGGQPETGMGGPDRPDGWSWVPISDGGAADRGGGGRLAKWNLQKRPAEKPPEKPDEPGPDEPEPDKPEQARPGPDKSRPGKPRPDKPRPDKPRPDKPKRDTSMRAELTPTSRPIPTHPYALSSKGAGAENQP